MYKMRKRKDAFFEQRKWLRMDELMASARPSGASIGRERAGSPRNRFATYSVRSKLPPPLVPVSPVARHASS